MIRVVFDTSVLYSAILKPKGVPAAVLDLVTAGVLLPCISPAVLAEYQDVLIERPALQPHAKGAHHVVNILVDVGIQVTPTERLSISDHEDDNRFYECAEAAQADYLVTGNQKHFPKDHQTTKIVNPRQLLNLVAAG